MGKYAGPSYTLAIQSLEGPWGKAGGEGGAAK